MSVLSAPSKLRSVAGAWLWTTDGRPLGLVSLGAARQEYGRPDG